VIPVPSSATALTVYDRATAFAAAYPDRAKHGAELVSGVTADGFPVVYGTWIPGQDYANASGLYGAYPKGYLEQAFSMFLDARAVLHLFSGSLTAEQVEQARVRGLAAFNQPRQAVLPGSLYGYPSPTIKQVRFDNARHPGAIAAAPDVAGDAEQLASILASMFLTANVLFDVVFADPPYAKADQRRYWREAMHHLPGACAFCDRFSENHYPVYTKSSGQMHCYSVKRGNAQVNGELDLPGYVRFQPLNKKRVLAECHKVTRVGGHLLWMDTSCPQYRKDLWRRVGIITIVRSTQHRVRSVFIFERLRLPTEGA
jgi:hypothetical protein